MATKYVYNPFTGKFDVTIATPVVVGDGGTGNTTYTAYSVICAGATATGAFQNVSGLGSSGDILTSAGSGALPAWTSPAWLTHPQVMARTCGS